MAQQLTALGYPYYQGTDSPAGHSQQQALADAVDLQPGVGSFTQVQIDAFTVAQKRAGRVVWNSTTGRLQRCDGSAWVNLGLNGDALAAHAASHASAGSDPVTVAQSQVTDLTAALAAKADTATLVAPGLTYITQGTAATAGSLIINNCFTSTYDSYRLMVRITAASATGALSLRLRVGGVDATTGYYWSQSWTPWNNVVGLGGGMNAAEWRANYNGTAPPAMCWFDIDGPALAARTGFGGIAMIDGGSGPVSGYHATATAYDGFTLYPESGTFSAVARVYGYKNS